ncbi:hypothetical protein Pelo_18446 [Pelomyxa schiedti]|nr:hypothetical protein Pelo_18446 [Pelomyxa schiedti]
MEGDRWWFSTSVYSNSRWIVLLNSAEMILWSLRLCNDSEECERNPLLTEDSCKKIKLGHKPYLEVALCEHDPDVLLMADMPDPFLRHVDLKESFNKGVIVFKKDPVPISLPRNRIKSVLGGDPICVISRGDTTQIYRIHNTSTNMTRTIQGNVRLLGRSLIAVTPDTRHPTEFKVFHTSDLDTPCIAVPLQRPVSVACVMKAINWLPCGVVVWECPTPTSDSVVTRYAITDALTDTLLADIKYNQ